MLSGEVENRILQYNPWLTQPDQAEALIRRYLPETYVLREAEPVNLQNDRALLIVGPRQSGKSTLAWRLLQSRAPNILYLNLEDPLLRSSLGVAVELAALLRERYSFIRAVFLDEAQHLTDAGQLPDALVALDVAALQRQTLDAEGQRLVERYLERRSLVSGGSTLAFVDTEGCPIAAEALSGHVRDLRRVGVNTEFNGALCRGLLAVRDRADGAQPMHFVPRQPARAGVSGDQPSA